MLLMPIFLVFDTIREESAPLQVALAVVLGAFLAVSPALSPQFALAILALCVIRLNVLATFASYLFFSFVTVFADRPFDALGRFILLDSPSLRRLCAGLYHAPIFPFTGFNNTVVLGSVVAFLVLALPLFLFSYITYRSWGPKALLRIQQSNLGLSLRASYIFRRYAEHITKTKK